MSRAKQVRKGIFFRDDMPRYVRDHGPDYHDYKGHPLNRGDVVKVRVRGNPRRKILAFYTDIKNGIQLDSPVKHGASAFVSWNGNDVAYVSSPGLLAAALTA